MSSYVWPPSLPQAPIRDGFSESLGVLVLRTPTDAGPAKMRYKGQRPDVMTMTFVMNGEQVGTLDKFVKQTLMGVRRFDFNHPRTGGVIEARIVADGDGSYYQISRLNVDLWSVSLKFEVLP